MLESDVWRIDELRLAKTSGQRLDERPHRLSCRY